MWRITTTLVGMIGYDVDRNSMISYTTSKTFFNNEYRICFCDLQPKVLMTLLEWVSHFSQTDNHSLLMNNETHIRLWTSNNVWLENDLSVFPWMFMYINEFASIKYSRYRPIMVFIHTVSKGLYLHRLKRWPLNIHNVRSCLVQWSNIVFPKTCSIVICWL